MYQHICLAVALVAIFVSQVVEAVPLRAGIVRRDNVEHVVVYQEVLQVVAATATIYVDSPAATAVSLTKVADASPPTPTPQAAKAVAATASADSSAGSGAESVAASGTATYYAVGMGSCGIESSDSQDVVALSHVIMTEQGASNPNANPLCGRKITIKHVDSGKTVQATVVDTCPGCKRDDIDLSPSCFTKIAALADGRVRVSWDLV